jgi:signal transduction histidine kinase
VLKRLVGRRETAPPVDGANDHRFALRASGDDARTEGPAGIDTGGPARDGPGLSRSVLAAMVVCALLVIAIAWVLDRHFAQSADAQVREAGINVARGMADHVARSLDLVEREMRLMDLDLGSGRSPDRLLGLHALPALVKHVTVYDASGRAIHATASGVPPSLAELPGFPGLVARGARRVQPAFSAEAGGADWSILLRRDDPEGDFRGAIVATLDPTYFASMARTLTLGQRGALGIVAHDGTLLAYAGGTRLKVGTNVASSPMFASIRDALETVLLAPSPADGTPMVYFTRSIADRSIVLVIARSEEEAFGHVLANSRLRWIAVTLGLAVLLAIGALAYRGTAILERQRSLAQAQSRAKSDLLAYVAHELRTPLQSILGFARLVERRAPDDTTREAGTHIRGSGERLLELAERFLAFSQIRSGMVQFRPEAHAIADVIEEALAPHRAEALEKGLRLESRVEPAAAGTFLVDRVHLATVLGNLVQNAVKFTTHGSVLVEVFAAVAGLRITVTDTGPGIPRTLHERVFEPFRRGDDGAAAGVGIGLALARQLATLMGGTLRIDPASRGARFVVDLPVERCDGIRAAA